MSNEVTDEVESINTGLLSIVSLPAIIFNRTYLPTSSEVMLRVAEVIRLPSADETYSKFLGEIEFPCCSHKYSTSSSLIPLRYDCKTPPLALMYTDLAPLPPPKILPVMFAPD